MNNEFFTQSDVKTINVNGTTFTALDVAKIIAFGPRAIHWDGNDTWISLTGATTILAKFCIREEGQEQLDLIQELGAKVAKGYPSFGEHYDADFTGVIDSAIQTVAFWGSLKLYTCLTKKEDGTRFINLDRLEAALDLKLGDAVRERLSLVTANKDEDGDWTFYGACGRSFRENATKGILYEIADAVNLIDLVTKEAIQIVKRGFTTFEEIAKESYAIDIDRMTQSDIDDVVQAIKESGVQPEEYTAYFSHSYNECQCAPTSELSNRWDFTEGAELTTFDTHAEAVEFRRAFAEAYGVQKRRVKLTRQVQDATEYLERLKTDLAALNTGSMLIVQND